MKHTILTCAKFKRLKHRLSNHMECTVIGALESLFLYAGANGPVMSASDVEAICGWTCGEDGVLLDALTDTGDGAYTNFLDVLPDGKVEIHDFWDHAPDCVKTRERQRAYREAKRNAVSRDSNATVTRQSRSCNDKPNQTKPNQYTESTDVLSGAREGKPKQQKLPGTQRMPFKDRAAACGYWDFHRLYPEHRRIDPKRVLPLWEAAIKDEPELTRRAIMEYVAAMIDNGEYTKENGAYCPGMVKFFDQKKWLSKPVRTGKLEIKENHDPDDDKPFGKKIIC